MPEFKDAGHRDHARHTGESPTTGIDIGPAGLSVNLDQWGPWDEKIMNMYLQSNWGEHPMTYFESTQESQAHGGHLPVVEACFKGRTLAQILEGISFWFTIDGVCRPATHQIVRTRGAAFMQHGGRDNDWRHRRFSMPETIDRACHVYGMHEDDASNPNPVGAELLHAMDLRSPITDWKPIDHYIETTPIQNGFVNRGLRGAIENHLEQGKELYAALVDAGIPWQDARRLLPMGLQTYIHGIYDYRTMKDTLSNRLELIMDWEYNCVGQLMVRELRRRCPAIVAAPIRSASDKAMKAAFGDLESWPLDGKYPATPEQEALPRAHRPEQNPFFILTDDALNGGPVEWIRTNGTYPHDNPKAPKAYKP